MAIPKDAPYTKALGHGLWRPGLRRSAKMTKPVPVPENIEAMTDALRDAICWYPALHGAYFKISLMEGKPVGTFRFEDGRTAWAKVAMDGDPAEWADRVASMCAHIMPRADG